MNRKKALQFLILGVLSFTVIYASIMYRTDKNQNDTATTASLPKQIKITNSPQTEEIILNTYNEDISPDNLEVLKTANMHAYVHSRRTKDMDPAEFARYKELPQEEKKKIAREVIKRKLIDYLQKNSPK